MSEDIPANVYKLLGIKKDYMRALLHQLDVLNLFLFFLNK